MVQTARAGALAGEIDGGFQAPPLQPVAAEIWDRKYRLRDAAGAPVDGSPDETCQRVADALAALESTAELREHWRPRFLWALRSGAIPAGRILTNAGAGECRPLGSTINCTVSGTIEDSLDAILARLHEAGMTLKVGSGIGYEFSTLRPRDAFVSGSNAHTSGPLSFMDIYDRMCMTISSAGGRRGAQMATFDVGHPDVLEFIRAKREDGRLRQFNLSLLVSEAFMEAVTADAPWPLAFPATRRELAVAGVDPGDPEQVLWRRWPLVGEYLTNAGGEVACRIHRWLPARKLWDTIMRSAYEYAEPGFVLADRVGDMNNNWFCESLRATNPCGEQPLPPYGACLLGSVNLTRFVLDPFGADARFDWERYREVVRVFTRMLDNVVAINGLALERQREELIRKRRHGMGFLGLGSALAMLGLRYGEPASLEFTERASRELAVAGWQVGLELAKEKGPAPVMQERFTVTAAMLEARPEMAADGYREGDSVTGAVLHARYSRYMQQLAEIEPQLVDLLARHGARFTHHSSVAPTGTIALSLANNASNGIEPSFAHRYARNVVREHRQTREKVEVLSYELLVYRHLVDPEAGEGAPLPECFATADTVTPMEHIAVQAAAQRWIDSSISKTVNVPADYPFEDFKDIYLYAWRNGLKGCTTFRFNPERFQGVLVREQDLERTVYEFTLEDGEIVSLRGNEMVEYDGETHTAANLYDALKEGYFRHSI